MEAGKYVITGGPSCGKTTLVTILRAMGFHVVDEVARDFIKQNLEKGISVEELRKNELEFQRKILELKLQVEQSAPADRIIFLDRGIPDGLAYLKLFSEFNGHDIKDFLVKNRYTKIFILEQLPLEKDGVRIETEREAKELNQLLHEVYSNLDYEITHVPKFSENKDLSIAKRLEFILENL